MNKIFSQDGKKFIIYHTHFFKENKAPSIIFSHGLMSSMASSKALALEEYCIKKHYNYIRYDNFGSGNSSGNFTKQNITTWLDGLNMVIDQVTKEPVIPFPRLNWTNDFKGEAQETYIDIGEHAETRKNRLDYLKMGNGVILIGSSKGAWLSLLAAIHKPQLIKGIICIASATDFTEELIWNNLTAEQQQELDTNGITNISGTHAGCNYHYPITKQLIEDGRKNLLLNKEEIAISCPVHFIHGMKDFDVPYEISMLTAKKISSKQVTIKLVKDGDHRLARPSDIQLITNSLEEIIGGISHC